MKNCRHVFHLVVTPVAALVLPYAELSDRCSHVFGFTHVQLTTRHYRTSTLNWRCADISVASAGWCTAQEHALSVAVYDETCHYLPERVIISTGWRRTLFLAHGDVLFSGRLLLESALHMPALTCAYVNRDILLELRTLVDRNVGWSRHISTPSAHKRYVCPMWRQETLMQQWCHRYGCQDREP